MIVKMLFCEVVLLIAWCASGTNAHNTGLNLKNTDMYATGISILGKVEITFSIEEVWGKITDTLPKTWSELAETAERINKNIKQRFEEAKNKIIDIKIELMQRVKGMAETAIEIGHDAVECLSEHEDDIDSIKVMIMTSVTTMGQCVVDKVSENNKLPQSIRTIIKTVVDIKDIIKARLDECDASETTINSPKCLADVADKIIIETVKLASEVVESCKHATNLIGAITTALYECAGDITIRITASLVKLAINIGICASDKMEARRIDTAL